MKYGLLVLSIALFLACEAVVWLISPSFAVISFIIPPLVAVFPFWLWWTLGTFPWLLFVLDAVTLVVWGFTVRSFGGQRY